MKHLILILTTLLTPAVWASTEFPIYGYSVEKEGLLLQVPTCKNRSTTLADLKCQAKASKKIEEGTGRLVKTLKVSCVAAKADGTTWCKAGDRFIAYGKKLLVPYHSIVVVPQDRRDPYTSADEQIFEGYSVIYRSGKWKAAPTVDVFIEEP